VSPIVVSLHDHHTSIGFGPASDEYMNLNILFNLVLTRIGENFYIKCGVGDATNYLGDRLVSINGIPPYMILSNIVVHNWYAQDCYLNEFLERGVSGKYQLF
jgi:hypothetical protein